MVDFSQIVADVETFWAEAGIASRHFDLVRDVLTSTLPDKNRIHQNAPSRLLLAGLCCEAAGGYRQQARWVTVAWALLYLAAHLLDNVADDRPETALPSSPGVTINAANSLTTAAGLALSRLEAAGASSKRACNIRREFYQTGLRMCAGQHDDLTKTEPTLEQCWQIAEAKSGGFFALACKAGAQLATDDVTRVDRFNVFGHGLGMLIQIADDVKDLWPTKDGNSDLSAGRRWTLPVAYAMSVMSGPERAGLRAYLSAAAQEAKDEKVVRRQIVESGALLYLAVEAERRRERAQAALEAGASPSKARDQLLALLGETAFHNRWLAPTGAVAG